MSQQFDLKQLILSAHRLIEAREGGARISVETLSRRIGVSHRALTEYERGTNQPQGMSALIRLLAQLEDQQIVDLVRKFEAAVQLEEHHE